jgi:hypothetical protein
MQAEIYDSKRLLFHPKVQPDKGRPHRGLLTLTGQEMELNDYYMYYYYVGCLIPDLGRNLYLR